MCRAAASVLSRIRLLSRLPADVIRFMQLPSIRAPLGRDDRTDGSCGSAGWRSDCAKNLSQNLLPIRPCAVGASRTTTFSQTPSTIHRLRFSMPGELLLAKEWRLPTCRDLRRRRHQTRDVGVLRAPTEEASRRASPSGAPTNRAACSCPALFPAGPPRTTAFQKACPPDRFAPSIPSIRQLRKSLHFP